jgi:mitochondrial fission protein ELM1
MIKLEGGSPRLDKLHTNLLNRGAVRVFDGKLESWNYAPLNDAQKAAAEITKRLASGGEAHRAV